jgi:hypothetical protein
MTASRSSNLADWTQGVPAYGKEQMTVDALRGTLAPWLQAPNMDYKPPVMSAEPYKWPTPPQSAYAATAPAASTATPPPPVGPFGGYYDALGAAYGSQPVFDMNNPAWTMPAG